MLSRKTVVIAYMTYLYKSHYYSHLLLIYIHIHVLLTLQQATPSTEEDQPIVMEDTVDKGQSQPMESSVTSITTTTYQPMETSVTETSTTTTTTGV